MLCTVEDVIFEGNLQNTTNLNQKIEYKIKNMSNYIHERSFKDLNHEKHRFNARMACVYGVLSWLESKRIIPSSSALNIREGNISITYRGPLDENTGQPLSYDQQYEHYMGFLLPLPPVGAQP